MRERIKFALYDLIKPFFPLKASRFRKLVLRWCGVKIGKNVSISSSVTFFGEGTIELDDDVFIDDFCYLSADAGHIVIGKNTQVFQHTILSANRNSTLLIGANCQIAHMVSLKTSTHEIYNPQDSKGGTVAEVSCIAGVSKFEDIVIGNGCWLCAGSIVIPGVKVGRRVVVAAGAVVTRDTPDNVLVAGVPARVKKVY